MILRADFQNNGRVPKPDTRPHLLHLAYMAMVTDARADRRAFADALQRTIEASDLSADDFAAEAEMTPERLAKLLAGRASPTLPETFDLWAVASWRNWAA